MPKQKCCKHCHLQAMLARPRYSPVPTFLLAEITGMHIKICSKLFLCRVVKPLMADKVALFSCYAIAALILWLTFLTMPYTTSFNDIMQYSMLLQAIICNYYNIQ